MDLLWLLQSMSCDGASKISLLSQANWKTPIFQGKYSYNWPMLWLVNPGICCFLFPVVTGQIQFTSLTDHMMIGLEQNCKGIMPAEYGMCLSRSQPVLPDDEISFQGFLEASEKQSQKQTSSSGMPECLEERVEM